MGGYLETYLSRYFENEKEFSEYYKQGATIRADQRDHLEDYTNGIVSNTCAIFCSSMVHYQTREM